ncbi:hypothetical protein QYE76_056268 [Lolium multiflorum]|uniref:ENTH domain-containing protein n=1 Tax=Lolium multiflorum TaxID=4521 RepID=A0AAD8WMN6_LOLMU|nr:hypothetical protein QYE76_056268 [Lolium multiflorum]
MDAPFFHELRRQASSYLTGKIRSARLALTDVTPTQLCVKPPPSPRINYSSSIRVLRIAALLMKRFVWLCRMTEEATNGDASPPTAKTMGLIARQAFDIDEYVRILDILHTRLATFDRRQWREPYKALLLLEHLLTHGPRSVALEFQKDRAVIRQMATFQHVDEKGFNWGLTVKGKSERVLRLLERGPFLEEERERARKVARQISGFGSFNLRTAGSGSSHLWGEDGAPPQMYGRSHSHYEQGRRWDEDDVGEDQEDKENLLAPRSGREEVEVEERHHHHPFLGFGQQRPEAMLLLSQ